MKKKFLNVNHGFLKADVKSWQQNSGCIIADNFVKNQNVDNDTSEHALGLLAAFNTGKVARSRKQQEYVRSIVSMLRQILHKTATSC